MNPSILVTGANGFVGTALCNRLVAAGHRVRGALRRRDQLRTKVDGVDYVQVDEIGPDTNWSEALEGVSAVIHLAARVHVMHETAVDPLAAFRAVNVAGTRRLARAAAEMGVRRFVYASSIKVNGESTAKTPFTETDTPAPLDPYGVSKYEAEQALHQVAQETGLEVVTVRPPLVYGAGVGGNFLRLLWLVRHGVPLPLSLVDNLRSMIYLGNFVDALTVCTTHSGAAGQTFLVSDGEDVSTPDLFRALAAALGVPARLFPFPVTLLKLGGAILGRQGEVGRLIGSLQVDSSKIRNTLVWQPPYTLAEGLAATARWYHAQIRAKSD